jgi:hypothetical protein
MPRFPLSFKCRKLKERELNHCHTEVMNRNACAPIEMLFTCSGNRGLSQLNTHPLTSRGDSNALFRYVALDLITCKLWVILGQYEL